MPLNEHTKLYRPCNSPLRVHFYRRHRHSELLQVMFNISFFYNIALFSRVYKKKMFTIIFIQLPDPWPPNPGIGSHLLQINVTFT